MDDSRDITLFLCGDVMTGRGIDQILPHPSEPQLFEPCVRSARTYVELAEERTGPIQRAQPFEYIWGDALSEWTQARPDARIINLETAVTTSADADPHKGIHYRMKPANVPCLIAAGIDCCVLANNHTLDWGRSGLVETLDSLHAANLKTVGAGRSLEDAQRPARIDIPGNGRVLVFAWGLETSGIPVQWAAGKASSGINMLSDLSPECVRDIAAEIQRWKQPGDIAVASIHWGGNWGYAISEEERAFAHALIDTACVDVVHGHSAHHARGFEVYKDRPVFYSCGDFLNDYEGISGHEAYRPNLTLMFFATFNRKTAKLTRLLLSPMEICRFRLERAKRSDAAWLAERLTREGAPLGPRVAVDPEGRLSVLW